MPKFINVLTNETVDVSDADDIAWYEKAGPPWHPVTSVLAPSPYPPSKAKAAKKAEPKT